MPLNNNEAILEKTDLSVFSSPIKIICLSRIRGYPIQIPTNGVVFFHCCFYHFDYVTKSR